MHLQSGIPTPLTRITSQKKFSLSVVGQTDITVLVFGLNEKRKMFDTSFLLYEPLQSESTNKEISLSQKNRTSIIEIDIESLGSQGVHELVFFLSTSEEQEVHKVGQIEVQFNGKKIYSSSLRTIGYENNFLEFGRIFYKDEWKVLMDQQGYAEDVAGILTLLGCEINAEGQINTSNRPGTPIVPQATSNAGYSQQFTSGEGYLTFDEQKMHTWDTNRDSFQYVPHCPYPDCNTICQKPNNIHGNELGWCKNCNRPFEWLQHELDSSKLEIYIPRRPTARYSTLTGELLTHSSSVGWQEYGGSPTRSSCLDDQRGEVFGWPNSNKYHYLLPVWEELILTEEYDGLDKIKFLNIVNGILVVTTQKGHQHFINNIDVQRPRKKDEAYPQKFNNLDWYDIDTIDKHVHFSPTFRDTQCMIVKDRSAILQNLLFLGKDTNAQPIQIIISPKNNMQFFGPPLSIDAPKPLFLLWQVQAQTFGNQVIIQDSYFSLYFIPDGSTTDDPLFLEIPIDNCFAPPIFIPELQKIIWVNTLGQVFGISINYAEREAHVEKYPLNPSHRQLNFDVTSDVNLVAGRNVSKQWVLYTVTTIDGESKLCSFTIPTKANTVNTWNLSPIMNIDEHIVALSTGLESPQPRSRSFGSKFCISTKSKVSILNRNAPQSNEVQEITSPNATMTGSEEPSIITASGVISRLSGKVQLSWSNIGQDSWNTDGGRNNATLNAGKLSFPEYYDYRNTTGDDFVTITLREILSHIQKLARDNPNKRIVHFIKKESESVWKTIYQRKSLFEKFLQMQQSDIGRESLRLLLTDTYLYKSQVLEQINEPQNSRQLLEKVVRSHEQGAKNHQFQLYADKNDIHWADCPTVNEWQGIESLPYLASDFVEQGLDFFSNYAVATDDSKTDVSEKMGTSLSQQYCAGLAILGRRIFISNVHNRKQTILFIDIMQQHV